MDLSGHKGGWMEMDAAISFKPFTDFLKAQLKTEKTVKRALYENALKEFELRNPNPDEVSLENIHDYEILMEHMYACLSPACANENFLAWGLCFPLQPIAVYGTDSMFALIEHKEQNPPPQEKRQSPEAHYKERLRHIYAFILKRLYNFEIPTQKDIYYEELRVDTGLLGYYHININTDFIEVSVEGKLPELNFREIHEKLTDDVGYEALETVLPLNMFRFRGISVISVVDVTAAQTVENLNKVRLTRKPGDDAQTYQLIIKSLKSLVKSNRIEFDLFPFVRVNDKPVFGYVNGGTGILFSVWGESNMTQEIFQQQVQAYSANPNSFFSRDILNENVEKYVFLKRFIEMGVRSLALIPVYYDHTAVGVLGIHTWEGSLFDESILAYMEPAMQPIARLLQIYIDEFNMEVENIIKEKFTSIQPAVQWKFNEVAWHYLHNKKKNLPERTETIHFNDVYPLYGAIDIRNSTVERNIASTADLNYHLNLLSETLETLKPLHYSSLMEEMIFNCKKWQTALAQEHWNTTDENNLNNFLKENIGAYFRHLAEQDEPTRNIVNAYLELSNTLDSVVHRNRHALEVSMQMINNAVNNYFEAEKDKLQLPYPCYFEKFRTDGIEYDIYIGQSIAPEKPFNHFHLKNLRLWQLSSMAAIARLTHSLLPGMPTPLHTTQLIFVHNQTIDISFRADERKFDVEGAYNIRYQMIKKRIDKVAIRNTNERLTQPDKLALIYFNRKDLEDYLPFIEYLQESGVLHAELEELELEDVQGLSGLKALRVGIVYS